MLTDVSTVVKLKIDSLETYVKGGRANGSGRRPRCRSMCAVLPGWQSCSRISAMLRRMGAEAVPCKLPMRMDRCTLASATHKQGIIIPLHAYHDACPFGDFSGSPLLSRRLLHYLALFVCSSSARPPTPDHASQLATCLQLIVHSNFKLHSPSTLRIPQPWHIAHELRETTPTADPPQPMQDLRESTQPRRRRAPLLHMLHPTDGRGAASRFLSTTTMAIR